MPACPLLGDGITDDTLLHIARFLPAAKDLLRLQLTNKRFTAKVIAAPSDNFGGGVHSISIGGGGGAAVGGGVQRSGARVDTSGWFGELAVPDARGGGASAAAGVRSGAW